MSSHSAKHGHNRRGRRTKEYVAWANMIIRCEYPGQVHFDRYGGRGISVCPAWRNSFVAFLQDIGLSPSQQHTLGRIDNDGNYEPGNVEWQTTKVQGRNTSINRRLTVNGITRTMSGWVEITGLSQGTLWSRLRSGWTPTRAITTPALWKGNGRK